MGYYQLGYDYYALGEVSRASEYFAKAFELQQRASERERLNITTAYYSIATGELDKAVTINQELIASYPRDSAGYDSLGIVYAAQGRYDKAIEITKAGIPLTPDRVYLYGNLADYYLAQQQLDEARQIIQQAQARRLEDYLLHTYLYALAFIHADTSALNTEQQWLSSRPEYEIPDCRWQPIVRCTAASFAQRESLPGARLILPSGPTAKRRGDRASDRCAARGIARRPSECAKVSGRSAPPWRREPGCRR